MIRAAIVFVLGVSAPVVAGDLVGQIVPPYPDGLVQQQGSCVSDHPGYDHLCDYAVGVLADGEGRPKYVVAVQSQGRQGDVPMWRVLDAIRYPAMAADAYLGHGTCRIHGQADSAIVAVVGYGGEVEWFDDVRRAWRLDFRQRRLVPIPVAGIQCANEGFGL